MYKVFNLSTVVLNSTAKRIDLKFNFDVDPKSIDNNTFNFLTKDGIHAEFTYKVIDDIVSIYLKEWPEPNSYYQLLISKNLKNISGQTLHFGIRQNIYFKSEITSEVEIVEPYNFQKIDNFSFKLKDSENISHYYVEIAKENKFYNIIYESVINTSDFQLSLPDIQSGQYYIRARVIFDNDYGKWSKPVTFIYKDICDCDKEKEDGPSADASMPSAWSDLYGNGLEFALTSNTNIPDNLEPDIITDLEVLTYPEQGITPKQFIFEFDKNLNPNLGEVIVIKREF